MKINTSSWHYRLLRAFDYWPENNLCGYVRQIIGALIMSVISAMLMLGVAFFIITPIYCAIFQVGVHETVFCVFSALYLMFGAVAINTYRQMRLSGGIWHTPIFERKEKDSQPNILVEFIRAKKQKICPTIEFVE